MLAPSIAVVVSAFVWGTLWIPLRQLGEAGLGGPLPTALGFMLPLLVLLPFGLARWRSLVARKWDLAQSGALLGLCVALYSEGLVRSNVAHVILLFYLTPVWSTLLARVFLGTPITRTRLVTVGLGLGGLLVVFGNGSGMPLPTETGEWMGLLSGFLWGLSMVTLRREAQLVSQFDEFFALFAFLGPVFVLLALVPGAPPWSVPTLASLVECAGWLAALGFFWMPAAIGLTMYGGSRLDPGRVAVLLALEVVIGLVSAAMLAHEPFGTREMVGAALIVAAAASEFFAPSPDALVSDAKD